MPLGAIIPDGIRGRGLLRCQSTTLYLPGGMHIEWRGKYACNQPTEFEEHLPLIYEGESEYEFQIYFALASVSKLQE